MSKQQTTSCKWLALILGALLGAAVWTAASPVRADTAGSGVVETPVSAEFCGASRFHTHAQELVEDLVAAGEMDLNELIQVVLVDNREVLDHIVVNLATQKIYECNLSGEVLNQSNISSGRKGYDTPPGEYHIVNKAPKAYSQKYESWMLHWMGLTSDGAYGLHGLEGSSYERHLGHVASHGCVRLSREYAKDLYQRVTVGLPVYIINDPELDLADYQPVSEQAVVALVLDAISPADPQEIFY